MMSKLMKAYKALESNNVALIIRTPKDLEMLNNIIPLLERYLNHEFLRISLEDISAAKRSNEVSPLMIWMDGWALCQSEFKEGFVRDKHHNIWASAELEKKSRSAVGINFMTSPDEYPEYFL